MTKSVHAYTIKMGASVEPGDKVQGVTVELSRNQSVETADANYCFTDHKINNMIEITVFVIQD